MTEEDTAPVYAGFAPEKIIRNLRRGLRVQLRGAVIHFAFTPPTSSCELRRDDADCLSKTVRRGRDILKDQGEHICR